ncbi:MAG: sigma-70 family RNA polymerase sigma factor [Luteitalea sp.]|nr:sigma-70 family RNA polymerase sigma factor [Luteitalea sp.]
MLAASLAFLPELLGKRCAGTTIYIYSVSSYNKLYLVALCPAVGDTEHTLVVLQRSSTADAAAQPVSEESWRLSTRACLGDSSAFGRLLTRCVPRLRLWAHGRLPRWARTLADTSDLIQDVLLRTIRRRGAFQLRGQRALGAYLLRAVQNRIRDEHRLFARRGTHEVSRELADPVPSPVEQTMANERWVCYRRALARLAPRDRELIVAHVELGYSHAQLGCMIGRSRNAARMALQRAVRRLAEQMGER